MTGKAGRRCADAEPRTGLMMALYALCSELSFRLSLKNSFCESVVSITKMLSVRKKANAFWLNEHMTPIFRILRAFIKLLPDPLTVEGYLTSLLVYLTLYQRFLREHPGTPS